MGLGSKLKAYWCFARSNIQRYLSYRINFFMFTIGGIMQTFIAYYIWRAVFYNSGKQVLEGFTIQTMLIYIFMSAITSRVIRSRVDRTIGDEVKEGTIAMNLIRPINYSIRFFFRNLGESLYHLFCVGLPLWIGVEVYRFFFMAEKFPGIKTLLVYFISVLFSFIILFLLNLCFGLLSFWVTNIWGFSQLKTTIISFCSGQLIPLDFFPDWAQSLLHFLPFASLNYTPVMIYLNKISGWKMIRALSVQVVWILVLFVISKVIWSKATSRLTILGG